VTPGAERDMSCEKRFTFDPKNSGKFIEFPAVLSIDFPKLDAIIQGRPEIRAVVIGGKC